MGSFDPDYGRGMAPDDLRRVLVHLRRKVRRVWRTIRNKPQESRKPPHYINDVGPRQPMRNVFGMVVTKHVCAAEWDLVVDVNRQVWGEGPTKAISGLSAFID